MFESLKSQAPKTVYCGVYAIYNAKVICGQEENLNWLKTDFWDTLKKQSDGSGVAGHVMDKVYRKQFKTEKIKYPTYDEFLDLLDLYKCVILRYKYSYPTHSGTHYAVFFKREGKIYCANPHMYPQYYERNLRPNYIEITDGLMLVEILQKAKVGNNQYPWAWGIK